MPDEALWDEWFNGQYDLNRRLDKAVRGLSIGKDEAFSAALWSSVIEHAAEAMRMHLNPQRTLSVPGQDAAAPEPILVPPDDSEARRPDHHPGRGGW